MALFVDGTPTSVALTTELAPSVGIRPSDAFLRVEPIAAPNFGTETTEAFLALVLPLTTAPGSALGNTRRVGFRGHKVPDAHATPDASQDASTTTFRRGGGRRGPTYNAGCGLMLGKRDRVGALDRRRGGLQSLEFTASVHVWKCPCVAGCGGSHQEDETPQGLDTKVACM